MIFSKERGKRELLKEFPEQVLNAYLPDRATEFVDDIVAPYANAYRQMRDHSYAATQGADLINAWFRRLDKIENNDWRPVSLWALRHHSDDPVWLDTFLKQLERLASSMLIRRVYNTPRVQRYAEILRELDAGAGLDSSLSNTYSPRTQPPDRSGSTISPPTNATSGHTASRTSYCSTRQRTPKRRTSTSTRRNRSTSPASAA
jgi:hypothetical protein